MRLASPLNQSGRTSTDSTTAPRYLKLPPEGACDFDLVDFNHQNVINAISISEVEGAYVANMRVEID